MNTLTQDQLDKIAKESYGRVGWSPTKADVNFANAAFALGVVQGESNQRKKNLEIILEGRKKVPLNPSDIGRPFFKEDHLELDRPSIKADSTAIRARK